MTLCLQGTRITSGVAIGPVHIIKQHDFEITEYNIQENFIQAEVSRYKKALTNAKNHLDSVLTNIPQSTPSEITAFIHSHLLMLDDEMLADAPVEIILNQQCNAEWALKLQRDSIINIFDAMEDDYLRTRRDDIDHVVKAIMQNLLSGAIHHGVHHSQEQRFSGHIIVADDISPSELVLMQHQGIAAFVTQTGGPTSHTAIIARSLNIPAIAGIHNIHSLLHEGETIIADGRFGLILTNIDDEALHHYHCLRREQQVQLKRYKEFPHFPAITDDGIEINMSANIELPEEIPLMHEMGANGIGLYRTEYLFMNRSTTPSEEEQFLAYANVLMQLKDKPLTIRTLDLGSDKQVDSGKQLSHAITNPALGLRAIRLCLNDLSLFIPQLRAILRVSALGPIKMMIPMLSNINELQQVLRLIKSTQAALQQESIPFDPGMPIGGMIEVPAAAICAEMFAAELDFLSIGTNDLIQYTLAIDRIDDEVNYLYDPLHPAVLKLIAQTIAAGQQAAIPVTMCGEMAGDPRYTKLLLGLGLQEFSMHPNSHPPIKQIIPLCNTKKLTRQVKRLLKNNNHREFTSQIEKLLC
ncbi:Phosphoenolpyruvate-protein phosphotransferase of PTS system [hydrothermal vent metagenome]|uniref:Phosphoenolpyruvate-protein phosphotransferase n=1 Tax=hydrothermal vent metagenome TaxID=652676 RepID=A0A3B1ASF7_9ZZZZ